MEVQQGQGHGHPLVPALCKLELWLEYEGSNDLGIFFQSSGYQFMREKKKNRATIKAEDTTVDLRKNLLTPRNYDGLINEERTSLIWEDDKNVLSTVQLLPRRAGLCFSAHKCCNSLLSCFGQQHVVEVILSKL